jgi:hypothetical protein
VFVAGAGLADRKSSKPPETLQPEPPNLSEDRKREMLDKEKVWVAGEDRGKKTPGIYL